MISIIFYVAFLIASAFYDGTEWKEGRYIGTKGHLARATIRLVIFSFLAALNVDASIGPHASASIILHLFIMSAVWWIAFDILVNVFANKPFHRVGTSAFTDRIFYKILKIEDVQARLRFATIAQYVTKLAFLIPAIYLNSPGGFDWFMREAHRIYHSNLWQL